MATTRQSVKSRGNGVLARGKLLVIAAATIVCVYLCYRLAAPFIPALVWAVTGAVITRPIVRQLGRRIESPPWRAGVAVSVVTVVVFAPIVTLVYVAAVQLGQAVQNWQAYFDRWQDALSRQPRIAAAWERIAATLDLTATAQRFADAVNERGLALASGSVHALIQALVMLFVLFYLYRDEDRVLSTVRQLSPLTGKETDRLLKRLGDTIHATIFGTVVVAFIQGAFGGVIFWLLGLPGAVLWGTVMALLAIIPYLGAFIVWVPAAAFLALEGHWWKSLILVTWGLIVIGLIDNLVYPMLVGNRLRQHTVVAFLAIVGGIAVFGASGVVLGPVVVSLTAFLLEIWRRRTEVDRAAENAA